MTHKCFVSQKSVNDCGVASLLMILKLYGIEEKYEIIKKKMKVDSEGSRAYDIIKTAKKYNLEGYGYKNYNINKNSNFPFIAHTIKNELQHFVVVLGTTDNYVRILDPAVGDKKIDIKEFKKYYTGIAITFKNTHLSYKSIISNKSSVFVITLLILLISIFSILYSYILSYTINKPIKKLILILLIISIIKELLDFLKNNILLKYRIKTDRAITIPTLKSIILLPLKYYQKNSSGEIISKVNDLSYVKEMYFVITEVLFVNLIIILFCISLFLFISFYLFIINILILLLILLFNKQFYKKNSYKNYDLQIKNEQLTKNISDVLNNVEHIKYLNKENYFINKLTGNYNVITDDYNGISKLYIYKNFIDKLLGMMLIILSIYLLKNNYTDILFVTYVENIILNSTYELCSIQEIYSNYRSAKKRLDKIYEEKININIGNKININSISFDNMALNKGDMLFVEGKTGSGKTTYFKKFLKENNFLYINHNKSSYYEHGDLLSSIMYVSQKQKLFNTSIINNITLGDKFNVRKNTYKVISKYLYKNNVDEDYVIDNQNNNISGGEIKLILIAQALNSDSDVIIFDETTNGLDTDVERKLLLTIKEEYNDKIIILISHRNTNKYLFNKYIYFSSGKLKYYNRRNNERIKKKRIKENKSWC